MVPPGRPVQSDSQHANEPPPPTLTQIADGRTIYMCHSGLLMKKTLEERNCDSVPADDAAGLQMCLNRIAGEFAELERLTAKTAACPQSLANPSDYYDALRGAALAGDLDAQRCFLAGYFHGMRAERRISEKQLAEYLVLARKFIQSALERGDWAVVHHLADGYVDDPGLLYRVYPYGTDHPETMYRMNYLLNLGSGGKAGSDEARNRVDAIRRNGRLSAAQIQAAEAWAHETYDGYFAAVPYNEKDAGSLCRED